jgi:hypothetical protein
MGWKRKGILKKKKKKKKKRKRDKRDLNRIYIPDWYSRVGGSRVRMLLGSILMYLHPPGSEEPGDIHSFISKPPIPFWAALLVAHRVDVSEMSKLRSLRCYGAGSFIILRVRVRPYTKTIRTWVGYGLIPPLNLILTFKETD